MKCKHCREIVGMGLRHHCLVQNREIIVVRDSSDFLDEWVYAAIGIGSIASTDTQSDTFSGGGGESGGGGSSGEW